MYKINPEKKIVYLERKFFDGRITREYMPEYLAHFILYYQTELNGVSIKSAKIVKNNAKDEIPDKFDHSF